MTESSFWRQVSKGLSSRVHACRVENRAGRGMSDVNACRDRVEVWIELKVQKGPRLRFEPSQFLWIGQRLRAGGRVFVLARKTQEVSLYSGGVCFGTYDNTPVMKGKKMWVKPDARYLLLRGMDPIDWTKFEKRIFEV
jgi:hypothetical protein